MQTLIAITYPSEAQAQAVLETLRGLQRDYLASVEDACIVTRDASGETKLHQTFSTTAAGATGGAFWGAIIGTLFLNPLLGLVVGGAAGALGGAATDYGISDDFIRDLAKGITPGSSALFILLRDATLDKVETELASHGGTLLYTNLPKDAEARFADELADHAATGL
ncbi:DUF1269 domain-containing protein [bacterium]|nr:MAG: DUF1269 domain-containing protein [bacterium]